MQGLSGKGTFKWQGKDENGYKLKTGIYIITIAIDGKEKKSVKVVLE